MLLRTIIQENTFAEFLDDGIRIFVTKPWFDERTILYSQILFIHFTQSDVKREFGLATLKLRSTEGEARIKNIREHREVKAFLVEKLSKIVDIVSSSWALYLFCCTNIQIVYKNNNLQIPTTKSKFSTTFFVSMEAFCEI